MELSDELVEELAKALLQTLNGGKKDVSNNRKYCSI